MRDMVETSSGFSAGIDAADVQAGRVLEIGADGRSAGRALGDALSDMPVLWRLQGFDHGGNCYGFETTRTGDRSRVVINGKAALELPRAVWDALLDAVALQRAVPPKPRAALTRSASGAGVPPTSMPPASTIEH